MLVVFTFLFVQVSLWRCNLETTDWIVVPGAWVPNPPNADGCTAVAFWGLGFGKVKALLRKPRHQHLLVRDPLNSVGWWPMALRRFPFLNHVIHSQTHTLKGWPRHRLVKIGLATRPSIAKWQFQNSCWFFLIGSLREIGDPVNGVEYSSRGNTTNKTLPATWMSPMAVTRPEQNSQFSIAHGFAIAYHLWFQPDGGWPSDTKHHSWPSHSQKVWYSVSKGIQISNKSGR